MSKIKSIKAREIIDSRGYPTIEGKLILDDDKEVTTAIPAGTSIGKYEARELRDGDSARFEGMGVLTAVSYINDIIGPKLVGVSPLKQKDIDYWLVKADGTHDKSKLGANTLLTVSQLVAKGAAQIQGIPIFKYINSVYKSIFNVDIKLERIPTPIFNILNGGAHANNNLEFQEFQIITSSSFNFAKGFQVGIEIFHELRKVLQYRNANISVGEEGGYAPNFPTNIDGLEVLSQAVARRNLKLGLDVFLGLDIAASNFYKDKKYHIKDKPSALKTGEYIEFILSMIKNYPFLAVEDPVSQDDFESWRHLEKSFAKEIYLIGDDFLATNKERLLKAVQEKACSTIIIKPNQIGTITETMEVIDLARRSNISYIVSHRSGETNDSFIADFAVGVQSDFVKFGAPSRGERVAKYNRLLEIETDELNAV